MPVDQNSGWSFADQGQGQGQPTGKTVPKTPATSPTPGAQSQTSNQPGNQGWSFADAQGKTGGVNILPSFPPGSDNLPIPTNDQIKDFGVRALPLVAATAGSLLAPEFAPFLPEFASAIGGAAAGGAVGQGAAEGVQGFPNGVGGTLRNMGTEGATQGAGEAGGRILAAPLKFLAGKLSPTRLYQGALKPSMTLGVDGVNKVVDTGLNEGIPVGEAGHNKLIGAISDLNQKIKDTIAQDPRAASNIIDPKNVAQRLDSLIDWYSKQVNGDTDVAAIKEVRDNYLAKHSQVTAPGVQSTPVQFSKTTSPNGAASYTITPGATATGSPTLKTLPYSPLEAQSEKQATYAINNRKYGEMSTAATEAEKGLARGIKEELASLFPELNSLNARDSSLIALESQISRSVVRHGNKNVLGLIPAGMGAATGFLTGHGEAGTGIGTALGAALIALDNPEVKTNLAIALRRAYQTRVGNLAGKFNLNVAAPAAIRTGAAIFGSKSNTQNENR